MSQSQFCSDLILPAGHGTQRTKAITKEQQQQKAKLDRIFEFQNSTTNSKHSLQRLGLDFWRWNVNTLGLQFKPTRCTPAPETNCSYRCQEFAEQVPLFIKTICSALIMTVSICPFFCNTGKNNFNQNIPPKINSWRQSFALMGFPGGFAPIEVCQPLDSLIWGSKS